MSTLCEFYTDREYEIVMGEEAPQVSQCVNGIEDEIIEEELELEYFEDGVGTLSFTDETGGIESDYVQADQNSAPRQQRGLPTVIWLKERKVHIANLLDKVKEYQGKVICLSEFLDRDDEVQSRDLTRNFGQGVLNSLEEINLNSLETLNIKKICCPLRQHPACTFEHFSRGEYSEYMCERTPPCSLQRELP